MPPVSLDAGRETCSWHNYSLMSYEGVRVLYNVTFEKKYIIITTVQDNLIQGDYSFLFILTSYISLDIVFFLYY